MARNGDITVELVHELHNKSEGPVSDRLVTDRRNFASWRDPPAMDGIFRAVLSRPCEKFQVGGECLHVGMLPEIAIEIRILFGV